MSLVIAVLCDLGSIRGERRERSHAVDALRSRAYPLLSATIRPSGALQLLAGAAALETLLLVRLITHPAGGWWEDPWAGFKSLGLWASGPFVVAALPLAARVLWRDNQRLPRRAFVILSVIGPVSMALALLAYGHAMGLILLTGLVAQSVCAAATLVLRAKPDTAAESGGV